MDALKTDLRTDLRTERLLLRPSTLADAPRAGVLMRDWDVARMLASFPFPQPDIAVEGRFLIEQARRGLNQDYVFAIDLPGAGLIGIAGAHVRGKDYQGRHVEIGYWIGRPFWGRGFATEAVRALVAFAEDLGRGPLMAQHFADNPLSGRVLTKNGFAYTGETRRELCLARREIVPSHVMERCAVRRVQAA